MAAAAPLAERLNRRWQPVDEQAGSWPIVYVKSRPKKFNASPETINKSEMAASRKTRASSKTKGKSVDQSGSPAATHRGASDPVSSPSVSESSSAESQTILVQRKASDASSLAPVAVVNPALAANTPAVPNVVPHGSESPAEAGKTSKISMPTAPGEDLADQQSASLPLALGEAERSTPAEAVAATAAAPAAVVSPTDRVESRIAALTIVTAPTEQRTNWAQEPVSRPESHRIAASAKSSANSAKRPGADSRSQRNLPPLKVVSKQYGNKIPVDEYLSSPTMLPIVREQIMTEPSGARIDRRRPLPLANETPLAAQSTPGKSPGPGRSTHAEASAKHRRQEPVMMPPVQRVSKAQNETGPSDSNPPKPAAIDIDGIVNKVERRFMRRLAVEAERRRVTRWP